MSQCWFGWEIYVVYVKPEIAQKKTKSKRNQNVFGETIGIRMSIKESHCVFVIFQIYNRSYEQDYVRLGDTPHAYLLSALLIKRTLH